MDKRSGVRMVYFVMDKAVTLEEAFPGVTLIYNRDCQEDTARIRARM